nr:hypothetical protein [Vibrio lentus]PMI58315.1 hypothetical protein BCU41_04050 [Vibrio lentus]
MWNRFKTITGTKKGKAAIIAAFFTALGSCMPLLEPYLPEWVLTAFTFVVRFSAAFWGGV